VIFAGKLATGDYQIIKIIISACNALPIRNTPCSGTFSGGDDR
jgi:hypothetical protein